MPGQVKSTKTSNIHKRKYRYRKRYASKAMVKAAANYTMKVLRSKTETKYWDDSESAVACTDIGAIYNLTEITQGDSDSSRDGDSVTAMSYQIRFSATVGDNDNIVRLVVFQWHDLNSLPSVGQILPYTSSSLAVYAPYRHDTKPMFKILADKVLILDSDDPIAYGKIFISKGFNRKIQFNTPSGSTIHNGLYLLAVSNSGVVTHPSISYVSRCRYKDN